MHGRHLDAARREFRHDRIDLSFGQHEIAHHHALIAHLLEREPAAEREAGLQLDASSVTFRSVRGRLTR